MTIDKAALDIIADGLADIVASASSLASKVSMLRLMIEDAAPPTPHTLDVPYLSQWDRPDADDRRGDCGPTCLAMLVHYLTDHRPTVDEVATACGQPTVGAGSMATGFNALETGAEHYDLTLRYHRPLDIGELVARIDDNRPSIALINYGVLGEYVINQDSFQGGHWVLVVGYDDDHIIIHDPNWWGDRRTEGAFRHIPREAYDTAAKTPKLPYFRWGYQGLVLA